MKTIIVRSGGVEYEVPAVYDERLKIRVGSPRGERESKAEMRRLADGVRDRIEGRLHPRFGHLLRPRQ